VIDAAILDNLITIIVCNIVEYEGLNEQDVANKLVSFGTNGVIFSGVKISINTSNFMQKHVPFMNMVHCMAH
jgi:hypothetical protein